ncbi:potassium voltage-gated channel subfamily H member 5-like [Diorhabda sublineata]|uniref:potassium voltage-gated channel subfamily H member 5-like n=1 Tax=Diorhabda sublineata TaxID=1163346 RepID=UPI0024E10123|nr:potassium voltage-gated channel subfamily H member 5-like [Diorhabda sublineata]
MNAGFGKTFIFLLEQFTTLLIILHFYTSMFFAIPYNLYIRNNHVPVDSWISIRNLTITEYRLDTYFEGSMIVLSYFFGSYYHDPIKLPIEQLLLFFFTFTGRSFVLVIIGRMLSNFGFSDRADTEYENILIQVNSYMRSYQVPIEIQEQIIERFEYTYQKKYFNVQQMMTILTDHLKTELFLFGAKNLISNNPFLKSLKPNELALLFSHMKSMIFSKHEVILSGFQAQNNIYFILSGTVAGYSEGVEVFHAKDGDVFGIATLYTPLELANYWYVVAIETTEVYFINKKRMYTFMQDRPDVTKYFLEIFTERLDKLEQQIRQKYEGGEDIRELLKKGILLEKLKNRENIVLDMEIR